MFLSLFCSVCHILKHTQTSQESLKFSRLKEKEARSLSERFQGSFPWPKNIPLFCHFKRNNVSGTDSKANVNIFFSSQTAKWCFKECLSNPRAAAPENGLINALVNALAACISCSWTSAATPQLGFLGLSRCEAAPHEPGTSGGGRGAPEPPGAGPQQGGEGGEGSLTGLPAR